MKPKTVDIRITYVYVLLIILVVGFLGYKINESNVVKNATCGRTSDARGYVTDIFYEGEQQVAIEIFSGYKPYYERTIERNHYRSDEAHETYYDIVRFDSDATSGHFFKLGEYVILDTTNTYVNRETDLIELCYAQSEKPHWVDRLRN